MTTPVHIDINPLVVKAEYAVVCFFFLSSSMTHNERPLAIDNPYDLFKSSPQSPPSLISPSFFYTQRGEIVIKSDALAKQIKTNPTTHGLPFEKVIACNIGNPHQLGQKPLTFYRQVISTCHYPEMLENPAVVASLPQDVVARVQKYMSNTPTTGAYTNSKGLSVVRQEVADFIKRRDGHDVDPEHIWLTDGASSGVKMVLQSILSSNGDGVLTPIPQYPLYSATLQLLNASLVGYYLDEDKGWSMSVDELEKQYQEATNNGINVKAITIINPGNPTGQCLPREVIESIIKWCEQRNVLILADEVYQENVYSTTPFYSFHKVARDIAANVAVFSFHSASKGFQGECGLRAGYLHIYNVTQQTYEQFYKMSSISLCSNVTGQIAMGVITNPPQEGDESFELYKKERDAILSSLKARAVKLGAALNEMEGVSCQPIDGALYAFPQLRLPAKAIEAAKAAGKAADTFYALQLLDNTGICVVSGSGFKQTPGTFHLRTTILPSEKDIDTVIEKMNNFHKKFMDQYRD